jgi:ubiquinone/menaquinone biosynthesis C-methylase UbiE
MQNLNTKELSNISDDMKSVFNGIAASWSNGTEGYEIRERIIDMAGLKKNSIVADIGCGKGVMFTHILKTCPAELIAVDISDAMIEGAKAAHKDKSIKYITGDVLSSELPKLDAAIMYNSYPHFIDKTALAEKLSRHIRSGGCLIIAHGRGREAINMMHSSLNMDNFSVPIETAEKEAAKFSPLFKSVKIIDDSEIFFIKLVRE